jgi:hypothetical protein
MSAAFPSPSAVLNAPRARPVSQGAAESLVLAGIVLQCILAAFLVGPFIYVSVAAVVSPFPSSWVAILALGLSAAGMIALIFLTYTLSYRRIRAADFAGAQAPTLVFGIVSLFFGLIPGILEIIGYVKVGDAYREQQGSVPGYPAAPLAPPVTYMIACKACGRVYPGSQYAFCPACGQRLGA